MISGEVGKFRGDSNLQEEHVKEKTQNLELLLTLRSLLPFRSLACKVQWCLILTLTRPCPTPQEGRELSLEKPELRALVSEKLEDLHKRWDELETTTQAKARSLFDANRAELFAQSCSALESWLLSLQAQLHSDDYGKDLTSVNILLKKQQVPGGLSWGW